MNSNNIKHGDVKFSKVSEKRKPSRRFIYCIHCLKWGGADNLITACPVCKTEFPDEVTMTRLLNVPFYEQINKVQLWLACSSFMVVFAYVFKSSLHNETDTFGLNALWSGLSSDWMDFLSTLFFMLFSLNVFLSVVIFGALLYIRFVTGIWTLKTKL